LLPLVASTRESVSQRKLGIHASSVHSGGGLVLLRYLLQAVKAEELAYLILDRRAQGAIKVPAGVGCRWFEPTLASRFSAELALRSQASRANAVLCLGALPPLFRLQSRVAVFVQNRLIIDTTSLRQHGARSRLRIAVERRWFRTCAGHADRFIVQTPSMAALLERCVGNRVPISVLPFAENRESVARSSGPIAATRPARYDFIYVASGDAHKNHAKLVAAWRILAEEGIFPTLCLTLDVEKDGRLWREISGSAERFGLKIENAGLRPSTDMAALYESSRALIFPSTAESLGLSLVEARRFGLPVIASELDFVRDTLDPEESFDPRSETSIARAVKRFLHRPLPPAQLLSARQFLTAVLEDGRR